jgi:hypothetical protein
MGMPPRNLIQRQQERGVAEPVDQPALGYDLHPGADAGGAGANPHQAEIAILKCFKDPGNQYGVLEGPRKSLTCGSASADVSSQFRGAMHTVYSRQVLWLHSALTQSASRR